MLLLELNSKEEITDRTPLLLYEERYEPRCCYMKSASAYYRPLYNLSPVSHTPPPPPPPPPSSCLSATKTCSNQAGVRQIESLSNASMDINTVPSFPCEKSSTSLTTRGCRSLGGELFFLSFVLLSVLIR
ncbi:hypothetical protein RRG08_008480 [Elysia crispata]|uniref:Uncharacterized protein n=1 Tax=Elysia crispata TaxID=231223 RepID=A0AAE0Z8E6_9GAST|nr:hypothetical protein RRG08_008480 [Elysia crispata]